MKFHPPDAALQEMVIAGLTPPSTGLADAALAGALNRCAALAAALADQRAQAPRLVAELLAELLAEPAAAGPAGAPANPAGPANPANGASGRLDPAGPAGLAADPRADDARYQTWGVFELLVERCNLESTERPDLAEAIGSIALAIAARWRQPALPVEDHQVSAAAGRSSAASPAVSYQRDLVADLEARACCGIAAARLPSGDLAGAGHLLATAHARFHEGTRDLLGRAMYLDVKGSLLAARRRPAAAHRAWDRAAALFEELGEHHLAGRIFTRQAAAWTADGNLEAALAALHLALDRADPRRPQTALLATAHRLAAALDQAGRPTDSAALATRLGTESARLPAAPGTPCSPAL